MHRTSYTASGIAVPDHVCFGDNAIIEEIRKNVNRTPDSGSRGQRLPRLSSTAPTGVTLMDSRK